LRREAAAKTLKQWITSKQGEMDIFFLWNGLGWPLIRLLFLVSAGLFVANFIESLNWTHKIARISGPLIRFGHLPDTVGGSFSMAFFSSVAANTMLSEAFDQERISKKQLIIGNLFNSLPTYFLHLPTLFFITAPLIKGASVIYVGLTLSAAFLRTALILLVSHYLLRAENMSVYRNGVHPKKIYTLQGALEKTWKRFKKRLRTIAMYTIPIYILVFFLHLLGLFDWLEGMASEHLGILSWLNPEAIGIVIFQLAAEMTAGIAAAGALLDAGHLNYREVILALLAGNVISSPIRAARHQFPYYAGIFSPRLAVELIFCSQIFRISSIIIVGVVYYFWTG
jgi:hypothetical protein